MRRESDGLTAISHAPDFGASNTAATSAVSQSSRGDMFLSYERMRDPEDERALWTLGEQVGNDTVARACSSGRRRRGTG